MSEDYDTFTYDDEDFYEPVLDNNLPPVPPINLKKVKNRQEIRNPRPAPKQRPPLVVAEEPESNYEDLNDVKERAPPPRPDTGMRAPPAIPAIPDMRAPLAPPDMGVRATLAPPDMGVDPEMNYEDLNCMDPDPEMNYEDLNDMDPRPTLPPPPILPERIRPPIPPNTTARKNSQFAMVNPDMLTTIRQKLKKAEPPKESPKSQFPARPKMVVKPQVPNKPNLAPKPAGKMSSSIAERVKNLKLDSTDGKQNQTPEKKSVNNNNIEKNTVSPTIKLPPPRNEIAQMNTVSQTIKLPPPRNEIAQMNIVSQTAKEPPIRTEITQMNTADDPKEEEFDSIGEYMDAAEIMSLHCQPYYYENFTKAQEHKIFTNNTEDGTFVIRKSRGENSIHPYTILVYHDSRPFRLKIRYVDEQYAIGEWKADEIKFQSVVDLVEHYKDTPLMLIGAGSTRLTKTPKRL